MMAFKMNATDLCKGLVCFCFLLFNCLLVSYVCLRYISKTTLARAVIANSGQNKEEYRKNIPKTEQELN